MGGGGGGFEEMEPIFRQIKAEWSNPNANPPAPHPFLFHVHGRPQNDRSALAVCGTDFHSNTWEAIKSVQELEDMRDVIGIGGSWSDFVDYVIASIKSDNVNVILEGQSKSGGAIYAKLIAQKAKGMPRISISLTKLMDAAASDTMANISLELFKSLKTVHNLLINEQERCCQLTKILTAEQEKNVNTQRLLDSMVFSKRQKSQNTSDKSTSNVTQDSSDQQTTQTTASTNVTSRVVPAFRRAKVRGVLLQDTEDEQD